LEGIERSGERNGRTEPSSVRGSFVSERRLNSALHLSTRPCFRHHPRLQQPGAHTHAELSRGYL